MIFKTQVENLTSITISDTDKLDQYLTDGAADVINKVIGIDPGKKTLFSRKYEASPTGAITAFADGSGKTTVTSADHGLSDGDKINITGTTNYDGTDLVISDRTDDTFTITTDFSSDDATGSWVKPIKEVDLSKISSKEIESTHGGLEDKKKFQMSMRNKVKK